MSVCFDCRASTRLAALAVPGDTRAYAEMLRQACLPASRCASTGISLVGLKKLGEKLSVDRIVPGLGYVEGNMRLLASCLNSAKGRKKNIPAVAVKNLLLRWERVRYDELSA